MIMRFADQQTAAVFADLKVRRFGANCCEWRSGNWHSCIAPAGSKIWLYRQATAWRSAPAIGTANGACASMIKWRICFVWRDSNAWDVEIVDYH